MASRIAILGFFVLAGCLGNHIYVQQMYMDRHYLASTHVGTPDPRQERPPQGQRLLVSWKFPTYLFEQQLKLLLTVRDWEQQEEVVVLPVEKRWSYHEFYFPSRLLTYRIQVVNSNDEVVETWEHQLWTNLIQID